MKIAALILTLNEELHIKRCVERINPFVDEILVVDSGSTDRTISILEDLNVRIAVRSFEGYGSQVNFGLNELHDFDWVVRIDADEYLASEVTVAQFRERLGRSIGIDDSLTVTRRFIFEGKMLRWGDVGGKQVVRVVSPGAVRCDSRLMDEKFLPGNLSCGNTGFTLIDENLKGLNEWLSKHVQYSLLEAKAVVAMDNHNNSCRFAYYSMPLFWRCFAYFFYRYVFCLGFLDGRAGFLFHFLQCLWYRILVDARLSSRSLPNKQNQ